MSYYCVYTGSHRCRRGTKKGRGGRLLRGGPCSHAQHNVSATAKSSVSEEISWLSRIAIAPVAVT